MLTPQIKAESVRVGRTINQSQSVNRLQSLALILLPSLVFTVWKLQRCGNLRHRLIELRITQL